MIVAVLDTNVLASAVVGIARPESTPGELLRRWRHKAFTLIVSEPILAELLRTLASPYFASRLTSTEIGAAPARLRADAVVQPITVHVPGVATHMEDDAILATALSGRAHYLVTGDKHLQALGNYQGIGIVTPHQFLDLLEREALPTD